MTKQQKLDAGPKGDALFTRFGDDAYIDDNGKFIKSNSFREPDLSFLIGK